ncbi:DUF2285 domain-containing protein [Hirschia baltica]|uniref:T6SS Transcription factor RovC-like DNA binding domain-containing protein n=1 Tax=Hirschia baltica (strain ATCC 49814 / DSM 5838 / IFAM 1418) TaxID=582402 RepID=C6XP96_HIRBI|nr:DUF2285 domain-containing protein [Hirschia baltica]ACT58382.1 hypothetical protein Hbal_0683 [Hirschia baltica ATCC 49814]
MKSVWQLDKSKYNDLLNLPYSGWAWEFKRRDPELIKAYTAGNSVRPNYKLNSEGIGIFSLPAPCKTAESFGLHFLPNPKLSALQTMPFWLPEIMQFNFDASVELLNNPKHKGSVLHWHDIPGDKQILFSPLRRTKLSVNTNSYSTQIAIEADSTSVLDTKYLALKMGEKHLKQENINYLKEFSTHCQGHDIAHKYQRGYFPNTLIQALIALDGSLNKATQREISSALFGKKQTKFDWDNSIYSLKSRARRLISKGRDLMKYNYIQLL